MGYTFRFHLLGTAGPGTRYGICGENVPLGNWNPTKCVVMKPYIVPNSSWTATLFYADVIFPNWPDGVEYKFINWHRQGVADSMPGFILPPTPSPNERGGPAFRLKDLSFWQADPSLESLYSEVPAPNEVNWESEGARTNRTLNLKDNPYTYKEIGGINFVFPLEFGGIVWATLEDKETQTTFSYYERLCGKREMHFNQILPKLFCGSCPRLMRHLDLLTQYGIHTVVCLQADEDIERNFIEDLPKELSRSAVTLHELYNFAGIKLIHIPIRDMSSVHRKVYLPQAVWTLAGIFAANPDKSVYVHCNAGVGRAIGLCTAFLVCIFQMDLFDAGFLVKQRRTCAYIDWEALFAARESFAATFGLAADLLRPKLLQ